jgi:hypothetical protein
MEATIMSETYVLDGQGERQSGQVGRLSWASMVEHLRKIGYVKPEEVVVQIRTDQGGFYYYVEKRGGE